MNRREMLKGAVAIPGAAALHMLTARWALAQPADFPDDVAVLNYALTLEFLEAEFYNQGNARGLLSGKEEGYLRAIGDDENAHVAAISDTIKKLGGQPTAAPAVDFKDSFANRQKFLETSLAFENTGVSAYLGAAGFIKSKEILQAAAGIFGVEARHAAIIGNLLGLPAEGGVYKGPTETPMAKADVLKAIAPFLAGQGGPRATDNDADTGGTGGGRTSTARPPTRTGAPAATPAGPGATPAPSGPVPPQASPIASAVPRP
ncbi:MAG TPA: ferritin-like domain-containing protein [Actinomycetota bacterium]|nr:ferritin-like domain-containing protein [Actinomycetota bacterium]